MDNQEEKRLDLANKWVTLFAGIASIVGVIVALVTLLLY